MVFIPLIILFAMTSVNCKQSFENHQVLKVWAKTDKQAALLHSLEDESLVDLWSHVILSDNDHTLLSFDSKYATDVYKKLKSENIPYSIHSENLQTMIDASYFPSTQRWITSHDDFDLFRYHRLDEIEYYLKMIQLEFEDMTDLKSIGVGPVHNRSMNVLKINSERGSKKPIIFVDCGIHSREWVSVAFCIYLIHQLTVNRDEDVPKRILGKYEFHIMPVYNTDGYIHSWKNNRMWRKNLRVNRNSGCIGVDLNRNFDINFGGPGSSLQPCSDGYAGSKGNSEEETMSFVNYLLSLGNIKAYFNIHAFSQLWMYPYGYKSGNPKNIANYRKVSDAATKAIKKVHGEVYKSGSIYHIIYPASGSTVDYVYDKIKAEYSFALELRDKGQYGFLLPESFIQPTVEEVFAGFAESLNTMTQK